MECIMMHGLTSCRAPLAANNLGGSININFNNTRLNRHSHYSSASFPSLHKAYPFRKRRLCYVICAEENKQSRSSLLRSALGKVKAEVVFGCAIGIGIILINNDIAMAGPRQLSQKAPQSPLAAVAGYPLGGKAALKSLFDVPKQMASTKDEPLEMKFDLPNNPSMAEVEVVKMHAVKLMAHGEAETAVTFLKEAYSVYKNRKDEEPAYNVGMALVEILICQGKYKEALECNCLNDNRHVPSDGRIPLYKAIICTMLDYKGEAKKWWEQYIEAVEQGIEPPNL
ncbi:hypothetical protein LINPERPRIM_LOCUS13482 [Linum perenne]